MSHHYFDLAEDVHVPGRWYLGDPVDDRGLPLADPWQFRKGHPVSVRNRLKVPIRRSGSPLDFSTAGVGVTPIVHVKVASLFAELAPDDVQIIPVDIDSFPEQYCLLNTLHLIPCIDDKLSTEVQYWRAQDGVPEKVGLYKSVAGMKIDSGKVGTARVFRTWGWTIALIVSGTIKEALESIGATGTKFREV